MAEAHWRGRTTTCAGCGQLGRKGANLILIYMDRLLG